MAPRLELLLACACALAGCTGMGVARLSGPPVALSKPGPAAQAAETGGVLSAGELVGRVGRFDGTRFVPASGVSVSLSDLNLATTTDDEGHYGFQHLPAGPLKLSAGGGADWPVSLSCQPSGVAGFSRANLPLVPMARPAGLPAGVLAIAGVLSDPRGAAVPGGTVHAVDAVSNGGKGANVKLTADLDGFFVDLMPGSQGAALANGQAQLTAYGTTPGGVAVETTAIATLSLDAQPTQELTLGLGAWRAASQAAWAGGEGRTRAITASDLPHRRDELVLHLSQGNTSQDVVPDSLEAGKASFTLPPGITPGGGGTVELRVLGLVPAPSVGLGR